MERRPQVLNGAHPVEQGLYILATKEIQRLLEAVCQNIKNHAPGMIVYGRPRIGKSKAIEFIKDLISGEVGQPIPVYSTFCRNYMRPSDTKFYADMLHDFNFALPSKKSPDDLRNQIVNFFKLHAEKSTLRRVVLFMDEAQRLTEWHYGWLMDIYNDLDKDKISLTVISVGQSELLGRRDYFLKNKKAQIIGRFMVHEHAYYGIRDVNDMKYFLACYDEDTEFPEESQWSFTRYFFPESFQQGERLKKCAKTLFNLFVELRREHGLAASQIEIPMEYLSITVDNALKIYGANGKGHDWPSDNDWRDAIKKSGYIESEIYMALA